MRQILWMALLAIAAVGGVLVWIAAGGDPRRPAALGGAVSYSQGSWVLMLADGTRLGALRSVECGTLVADVVADPLAVRGTDPKHSGPLKPESCLLRGTWTAFERPFYAWVSETFAGSPAPRNLSIVGLNSNAQAVSRLELSGALITEFALPPLEATSKETAYFTIKVVAGRMTETATSGETLAPPSSAQKNWLASNFALSLDGIALPGAAEVASWTVKAGAPPRPALGNLVVEVDVAQAQSLDKRLRAAAEGENSEGKAQLTLLSPAGEILATLSFGGVGMAGGDLVSHSFQYTTSTGTVTVQRQGYSFYVEHAALTVP